jgi:serine/threonine protein kinase
MSKILEKDSATCDMSVSHTSNVGSPKYMAPELLSANHDTAHYSTACDIFSFGVILAAMVRRSDPYSGGREYRGALHLLHLVQKGHRPLVPASCPPALFSLMRDCWKAEPSQRINAEEALLRLRTIQQTRANLSDDLYGDEDAPPVPPVPPAAAVAVPIPDGISDTHSSGSGQLR